MLFILQVSILSEQMITIELYGEKNKSYVDINIHKKKNK